MVPRAERIDKLKGVEVSMKVVTKEIKPVDKTDLVALFVNVVQDVVVLEGAEDMSMDMPVMAIAMPVAGALDAVYGAVSELPVDILPMGTVDWPLIPA